MTNFLDQLVGLCAGRGALLRLNRRRLLEEFKSFQDNLEYKAECPSDCQLCMDAISGNADRSNNTERRSSFKPWEQPNHGIGFQHRPRILQPHKSVEALDPYELLRIKPISVHMPIQDAQQLHNTTISPTSSSECMASFPSTVMGPLPLLFRSHPCKIARSYENSANRATRSNSNEFLNPSQKRNGFPLADTDSHRYHTPAIMRHSETSAGLQRHTATSVLLDNFESDMKILTEKLILQQMSRREIIITGSVNRPRVRVEVNATGASLAELELARKSTTFRGDSGLRRRSSEAGMVDMYKKTHASRAMRRRWLRGQARR